MLESPATWTASALAWANLILIVLNVLVWLAARLWWLGALKNEVSNLRLALTETKDGQRDLEKRLTDTREEFQKRLAETREQFVKALTGIDVRLDGLIQQSDAKRLAAALQAAMQQSRLVRRTKVTGPNRRRKT